MEKEVSLIVKIIHADFTFSVVVESDITERTYLWLIPCLTNCKEYSVEEKQTNK